MTIVELFTSPFFQRALLAGLALGLVMGLLGVLVILRRLAFFSDALGHSALTGIALGILLNFSPFLGAFVFSLIIAGLISAARFRSRLQIDTLLGVAFPTAMALGVILVQLSPGYQADLLAFLFGDILAVTSFDVSTSIALGGVVLAILFFIGKPMVALSFDESLARAEGLRAAVYETIFLVALAGTIALAIKLVGIILVTALLIIPAATAQNLSRNLSGMFTVSAIINLIAIAFGLVGSAVLNLPSGPVIILTLAFLFLLSQIFQVNRLSKGFISFFALSLIFFLIAGTASVWITYRLYQDGKIPGLTTDNVLPPPLVSPVPTGSTYTGLEPDIRISADVTVSNDILYSNLVAPLRAHYATQPQQLRSVTITRAESDVNHDLKIVLSLVSEDQAQDAAFYYDADYPVWTPSLLDITD